MTERKRKNMLKPCKQGHDGPSNKYVSPGNGFILCRACISITGKKLYKKLKENNLPEFKRRHRIKSLKRHYGITLEQYAKMYKKQNGVCAICNKPETAKGKEFLAVDHDHTTNQIRQLLCGNCNKGLGLFLESPELLIKAITYMLKHKNR